MHVLLVEDDELVGDGIVSGLRVLGLTVDWVQTRAAAETALTLIDFDAVVLDLGLPDGDGMSLLRYWRRQGRNTPVLILTARDAVPDRVAGLEAGADDYLPKPFDLSELVARLRSMVRRAAGRSSHIIEHGPLRFDPITLTVTVDEQEIQLSQRELSILQALLQHQGRVLSTGQLQAHVYGWNEGVESNALAVHVYNLRRKLGGNLIETLRGLGYRLRPPREITNSES